MSREQRGGGGRDSGRGASRGGFRYQERDASSVKKRAEQSANEFDSYFSNEVSLYTPKAGDNTARIMPPTWPDATHYGFDIWVHYGIGADNSAYLCPEKMKGEACAICDERKRALRAKDEAYAKELAPNRRVAVWMIDRDNEKDGPKVWPMSWTIDRDISKISTDKRTNEFYWIDHPEDGYDIFFSRDGQGLKTKYSGFQLDRRPSPLGKDEWMDFVVDHPIPDMLQYFDYDHVAKVLGGGGEKARDDAPDRATSRRDDDEPQRDTRRGSRDDDAPPARSARSHAPDYTYEQVQDMDFDALCKVVKDSKLDIDPDNTKDDDELIELVQAALNLEPARRPSRDGRGEAGSRRQPRTRATASAASWSP